MNDEQIQMRFREGAAVFLDDKHVVFRSMQVGTRWHPVEPLLRQFTGECGDPYYLLQEFVETMWWTPEHERQLLEVLDAQGVQLTAKALQYMEAVRRRKSA